MRIFSKNSFTILCGFALLFTACSKNNDEYTSSSVPNVSVNLSININTSAYATLASIGGIAYLTNVGYRGIVLYRLSNSSILAFDRTCTYDLPDANGVVYALTNGTAVCADCNSIYNLTDGSVNTGPTTIGLKEYTTSFNATTGVLTITN